MVAADLSHLDQQAFWEEMAARSYVWSYDEHGRCTLRGNGVVALFPCGSITGFKCWKEMAV